MKRLVWLVLLAFCTALAQVQPVDLPGAKDKVCCCCGDQPGACGMPDCLPLPATGQLIVAQPVTGQPAKARRLSPAPRRQREKFYVRFVPRATPAPAVRASSGAAASAGEPLFKVHCSFLL